MFPKSLILTVLFLSSFFSLQAQEAGPEGSDPKANDALDQMAKVYAGYKDLTGDFMQKLESPDLKTPEVKQGKAAIRGNKYRIQFPDEEYVCDEKTIWVYIKSANEVNITDAADNVDNFTPDKIFRIYKTTKNRYIGEVQEAGKTYTEVELYAVKDETSFSKIQVWINKSSHLPERIKIFNRNATQITFELTNIKTNNNFPDTYFVFDPVKHPGVEIVDQR